MPASGVILINDPFREIMIGILSYKTCIVKGSNDEVNRGLISTLAPHLIDAPVDTQSDQPPQILKLGPPFAQQ